jgi:hypothetical protein
MEVGQGPNVGCSAKGKKNGHHQKGIATQRKLNTLCVQFIIIGKTAIFEP